ncbi:MAG: alpha/beta fold hydrolase [Verrucomicrobia bacterium]|nr:alpha/beta fold hydrolase [Verrucomicrobiota bacterium]
MAIPLGPFFYRDLVQQLRPSFRCIVPDHIGCGLSDKPGPKYPYRLQQHAANLRSLVDGLALGDFHLVVHDWGGGLLVWR